MVHLQAKRDELILGDVEAHDFLSSTLTRYQTLAGPSHSPKGLSVN
jgi:hypothetical protein